MNNKPALALGVMGLSTMIILIIAAILIYNKSRNTAKRYSIQWLKEQLF